MGIGEDFDAAVALIGQAVNRGAVIAAVWLAVAFLLAFTLGAVRTRRRGEDEGGDDDAA